MVDWAQVELNVGTGDVSSPIGPTTTGSVTRNAETATVGVSSLTLNPFSAYASWMLSSLKTGQALVTISDTTTANIAGLTAVRTDGKIGYAVLVATVIQAADPLGTPTTFAVNKCAARIKANDFAAYSNPSGSITDFVGSIPTLTTLYFGTNGDGTGSKLNGWIREFKLWTYDLDNTRLSSLVTS